MPTCIPRSQIVAHTLRNFRACPIGAIERTTKFLVKLRAIGGDAGADAVEYADGQSSGIGLRLEH